jgi:hypothetical protein
MDFTDQDRCPKCGGTPEEMAACHTAGCPFKKKEQKAAQVAHSADPADEHTEECALT